MATTKDVQEIKKARKELLILLLKKADIPKRSLIEHAEQSFVAGNLDLLSATEKNYFKSKGLVL